MDVQSISLVRRVEERAAPESKIEARTFLSVDRQISELVRRRFALLERQKIERFPDSNFIALCSLCSDISVTRSEKRAALQGAIGFMTRVQVRQLLCKNLLSRQELCDLLFIVKESRPLFLWQLWASGELRAFEGEVVEKLIENNEFCSIAKSFALVLNSSCPFQDVIDRLVPLFSRLHCINKERVLPRFSQVASVIKTRAETCSPQELLTLVHLMNDHYFFETNQLIGGSIYDVVKNRFPFLKEVYRGWSLELRPKGAVLLLEDILSRKSMVDVLFFPRCVDIKDLGNMVADFRASHYDKAVALLYFGSRKCGHFSPLVLERRGAQIHIVNTDSVHSAALDFAGIILQEIHSLPFASEIRVHMSEVARQYDDESCLVFSIEDLKEAISSFQRKESFLDSFLPQGEASLVGSSHQYTPLSFPPSLLKMTQSLSRIEAIAEGALLRRRRGVTTLKDYILSKSYYIELGGEEKRVNRAAHIKAAKYFERLLQKAIEVGSPHSS